jgi:hypothetical protein
MANKKAYSQHCQSEKTIPIFSKDWWLDAVCGEKAWEVILVKRGDEVVASMPYYTRKYCGLRFITMPKLTQTMGPWIKLSGLKYAKRLSVQKDLMFELIEKLPPFHNFAQNFSHSITNWLPFFWNGFEQTTLYTYVLEDLNSEDKLWDGLLPKIRTDIRKAENRFQLQIRTDLGIDRLLEIIEVTFKRQGKPLPYSKDFVKRLDAVCEKHNAREIFFAVDKEDRVHAVAYIVWDSNSAYYLMGGADPALRNSGASSLCLWEAIKFASTVTNSFDFEGSMVESVERFFRGFGAVQKPYFHITKTPSRLLRLRRFLKDVIRR